MEQVGQTDGLETRGIEGNRIKDVRPIDRGPVPCQPRAGRLETIGVQIHQREPRAILRETTPVQKISGADPDIQMIRGHVPVVQRENMLRGTPPDQAIRESQHQQIVDRQHRLRIDSLACLNLFPCNGHQSPLILLLFFKTTALHKSA